MSPRRWRAGAIPDPAILAEASAWHERLLDTPNTATTRAFEAWRAASADHDDAYRQVRDARDLAASLADDPALLAFRHETLARATVGRPRLRISGKAVAAGLLLCVGAPLAALGINALVPTSPEEQPLGETFRTGIGQRADVILPDGSRVTLDTASGLQVRFDKGARKVRLRGQAWFDLKPSAKPFVIAANGLEMTTDAGTFDVRVDRDLVRAFAVKGNIALAGQANGGGTIVTPPGHLLAVQANEVAIRKLDNPASFTGWYSGMLQFENVPVMAAAQELNRYRRQPIRVADDRVANMRISGAFKPAENSRLHRRLDDGLSGSRPARRYSRYRHRRAMMARPLQNKIAPPGSGLSFGCVLAHRRRRE